MNIQYCIITSKIPSILFLRARFDRYSILAVPSAHSNLAWLFREDSRKKFPITKTRKKEKKKLKTSSKFNKRKRWNRKFRWSLSRDVKTYVSYVRLNVMHLLSRLPVGFNVNFHSTLSIIDIWWLKVRNQEIK